MARLLGCLGLLAAGLAGAAQAGVHGAGATFPSKVYARWGEAFKRDTGTTFLYDATGSGEGQKRITARQVQFGASDSPLAAARLSEQKLVQIPTMVGGVVPVVNLPGVAANRLQLSGEVLAAIALGEIRQWSDPRIAAQNPRVSLPALTIVRVVRADRSGTTEGYARYLAAVSPEFGRQVPPSMQPAWPGETTKADGNDGVIKALRATPGAITYTSYDRVVNDKLAAVRLVNKAGIAVEASEAGFRAAVSASGLAHSGDGQASLIDQPGATSWPITLATFVLLDAQPRNADAVRDTVRFFYWSFMNGDRLLEGTGFAPLPTSIQARLMSRLQAIRPQDGSDIRAFMR